MASNVVLLILEKVIVDVGVEFGLVLHLGIRSVSYVDTVGAVCHRIHCGCGVDAVNVHVDIVHGHQASESTSYREKAKSDTLC